MQPVLKVVSQCFQGRMKVRPKGHPWVAHELMHGVSFVKHAMCLTVKEHLTRTWTCQKRKIQRLHSWSGCSENLNGACGSDVFACIGKLTRNNCHNARRRVLCTSTCNVCIQCADTSRKLSLQESSSGSQTICVGQSIPLLRSTPSLVGNMRTIVSRSS